MTSPVTLLSPKTVWRYFQRICEIPHGSGNEEALAVAITQWATAAGAKWERDDRGNIKIDIDATQGLELAPRTVIQAHLDMVCEKNEDRQFNFETDPIELLVKDGWVTANQTSLGADNGIGLAMGLALLEDKDAQHGPITLLFTLDEERGLYGAMDLAERWLSGTYFINTDAEDEGVFIVGCAGGFDTDYRLPAKRNPSGAPGEKRVTLRIAGLLGGHSGMEINRNRGNAIRLLALQLGELHTAVPFKLCSFEGGDKHNAIPREASATIAVAADAVEPIMSWVASRQTSFTNARITEERQATFTVAPTPNEDIPSLTDETQARLLNLLITLPHGVLAMTPKLPGVVERSSNLARVTTSVDSISVLTSSRSSNEPALAEMRATMEAHGRICGAAVDVHAGYPPWAPDFDAEIITKAQETYKEMFGESPSVETIHAGLECGIIKQKYPAFQMLALGPNICGPHSPYERVDAKSVDRTYQFLRALLARLCG